ncbi:hypothetical protein ACJMK2_019136 [Sinanodonta woodiana]|uniref:UMOD/GP2/OIT3-like D8C domain-containing protein n=1 Tax=Sinanodonta woodiana TaxID=1069815 RepID=A0ABD3UJI3_SINWO
MSDRCPDCEYLSNDRSDLYDLDHDTWYITTFKMTTRYVSPSGCGTRIPIWMNGTIPMIGEGVVSRTACLATFQELCALSYSIKVKRCDSSYTVYCLDNLPSSVQQRYCFDFDPSIFTTTTLTTTSAKLPTTEPARIDREGMHIYKDTGVQSWVTVVIASLSITIVVLVAIIVVVYRQFRKNHKRFRTFPYNDMPPPYNQVIGFIPIHEKELTPVVNVRTKY